MDVSSLDEYASEAELLQEFTKMPSIEKAWVFPSESGNSSKAMFSLGQIDLLEDRKRTFVLSSLILKKNKDALNIEWSPFPVEMLSASAIVPSPSGSKLLVVRNKDKTSTLEIWGPSKLEKEITIPHSVHGSVYADGWFEGISWHHDENLIAYIAEEPPKCKPIFDRLGCKKEDSSEKDPVWKGQGELEEDWGETYTGKRKASLFVVNIGRGEVQQVEGIDETLSVGQVVWAPPSSDVLREYLVFVGWPEIIGPQKIRRRLGMKVCYNRPCALYSVMSPFREFSIDKLNDKAQEPQDCNLVVCLTPSFANAYFPRFSPDGKFLLFMSAESAVDTGAHSVTQSLNRMMWPSHGKPHPIHEIVDVVPIVMCPEDGLFPGLYCANLLYHPWLSDGFTLVMSSVWGSTQVILAINTLSGRISRISPTDSNFSWNVLAIDGDNILAISSSPVDPPQIKYGYPIPPNSKEASWDWQDVSLPFIGHSEKLRSLLSSVNFSILKIPVNNSSKNLPRGANRPFESIFVSVNKSQTEPVEDHKMDGGCNPLIVLIHGGPHSVSMTNYSKSAAFFASLGYYLLIINYRGSLGFGEEALQSLPGKIGSQDVNDILTAMDYVIAKGLVNGSKVAAYGSSHGGFLTTHLIGQVTQSKQGKDNYIDHNNCILGVVSSYKIQILLAFVIRSFSGAFSFIHVENNNE
ncbi:Acylaminoacyl-peptidase protein [Dioscorea alata]|uniref:Acylaminoacyl-peptidase protein n=3 Tax=Dioscorea alata TaxID=55571 RepID=A0ACB7UY83_DIOAL|nr:Acylaminoacyl-peptidase protein [Dioscorea alata]KAH7665830.1 Acylaminoacyl-peptidase protein [Dioscorea alata]KAH7665832.1 Acylaminoacyl-peptidase protein [Dioscorea alata]